MSIDIDRMAALARHGAAAAPDAALALIARLRETEEELTHTQGQRDAAILRAQRAEDGEQALAAHLDRFMDATSEEALADDDWTYGLDEVRSSAPAVSLARRDAEKQAEAMSEALDGLEYMDREVGSDRGALDATRDELRERIRAYRCQAEQADTDGEDV